MSREATDPPAVVNVLDVSSESMAAFQVFLYGRFWVFTEVREGSDFGGYTEALELLAIGVRNAIAAVVEPEPQAELAQDVDAASRDAARLNEVTSENLARRGVGDA